MQVLEIGRDKNGLKKYRVDFALRDASTGQATHLKRTVIGSGELAEKIVELKNLAGVGSLTDKTFAECSEYYKAHKGYGTKKDVFERNARELGRKKVNDHFALIYSDYIHCVSETHAVNTTNNYRICIRSVLNYCYKAGFLQKPQPVRDFGLKPIVERDRIWTADERTSIYNVMEQGIGAHLYWSVRLAEKNPIRGISDLWNLQVENLILFGETAPCIKFYPQKTNKKQNKPTYLIELDDDLIQQLKWQIANLPDCPYLFPHLWQKQGVWKWKPMGNPKKAWGLILEKTSIQDFHFHDLRHVATTYMLEKRDQEGQRIYDEDDMKNLGLFYSQRAIEIYRNRGAERVIARAKGKCSTFVAPAEKLAI